MGMQTDGAPQAPDTYGLHEDFVTDIQTEIIGPNVRLIIGVSRGGQTHWVRTTVIPADRALEMARIVKAAAEQAASLSVMMLHHLAH